MHNIYIYTKYIHTKYIHYFKNNVQCIGVWVYFWALYLTPLVHISVSVPVPYFLDDSQFVA